MKICVLQSSYEGSSSPCNGLDPAAIPELWLKPEHEVDSVEIRKVTAASQLVSLSKKGYDVFLNLCDGGWDEDRAGMEVVEALERLNLPYTGATPAFYDPSKELMKIVALSYGVNTPGWQVCYDMDTVEEAGAELTYPVIVKHQAGYNSVGLTKKSRCTCIEELRIQADLFLSEFGGCMVEEFIDSREFTVLVSENPDSLTEPLVFTPVECKFPQGETFKHFDLKWKDYEGLQWVPVEDPNLNQKLRLMAQKVFIGLGGTGYGRLDARGDKDGNVFFLEMNPNCGIFYPPDAMGSADFIISLDPSTNHEKFARQIVQCALLRHQRKQPRYTVRYSKIRGGFGLYAARELQEGEVVEANEEAPTHLVSKGHVESTWDEQKKLWFRQYAWPLSENISAMWSDDPTKWKPINHSCDPNTWLVGLNTVARRPVKKGEELTIDYATFCADCEEFTCQCRAASCRGKVTGKDYLAPWLEEKYGDHVSDYIRQARKLALECKRARKVYAEEQES